MFSACDDDYGADAGDGEDDDGDEAVHIDRAHMRLAACDALYEAQAPTTLACKALTCCLQGLGLLHRKLASKAVGCRHDASW